MRKVSSPYNVNSIALECLPEALADEAYISWYADQVLQSRAADGARFDAAESPLLAKSRQLYPDEYRQQT